jgi:hypothetical protein
VTYPRTAASVELTLSPNSVMTSAGDTRAVTAVVKDVNQSVVPSPSLTWTSDDPAVATVVGTGSTATITAIDDGVATITARVGSVEASAPVLVRRAVASIVVTSPKPVIPLGSTAQLATTGLDARGNPLSGLTGFTFTSSNPGSVVVSNTGVVTAIFAFPALPSAIITATLTKDGVTATDTAAVSVGPVVGFDHAALMLSDFVKPNPVPTAGAGVAFFFLTGSRINYTVTWSALSGPAVEAHLHGASDTTDVAGTLVDLPVGMQTSSFGVLNGSFGAADIRSQGGRPAISLDSLVKLLAPGKVYMDLHTQAFPAGEIRGQVEGPFR